MAKISHKYKHVKGVDAALAKLQKIKVSIKQRGLELLFYLTASVHYDFISKIVMGEVEDLFDLAPNSICYLLEYKWKEVQHDKLFMLTGGYVKSIQVLNIVESMKSDKSLTTLVIGIDDAKYSNIAELLELGGGIMSIGSGGSKAYTMPERPLWSKYRQHMTGVLHTRNWAHMINSDWRKKFQLALDNFVANVIKDSNTKGDVKLDIKQIARTEQAFVDGFINANDPKGTMSSSDLRGIAEDQRSDRNFSDATWGKILQKFKDLGDPTLATYAQDGLTELKEEYTQKSIDFDDGSSDDILDRSPF